MRNTFPQQPEDDLRVDTAWRENYSGASMNQKLHGLLPKGVYSGFEVKPKSGLTVEVSGKDMNVAVIEVGTYSLTARMPQHVSKVVELKKGKTQYVVLEAQYALHQSTSVGIFVRDSVPENGVMLAKVSLPHDASSVSTKDIQAALPAKPVTASDYAELAAYVIDNGRRTIELQDELNRIKNKIGL